MGTSSPGTTFPHVIEGLRSTVLSRWTTKREDRAINHGFLDPSLLNLAKKINLELQLKVDDNTRDISPEKLQFT